MQTDKAPLLPQEPVPTYKNEPAPTQQSTATENYYANPVPPKDYEEYHTVQSKQSMNEAGMIFSLVNGCCGCLLAIIGVGLTIALIVEYNNATQHPLYRAIFGLTIALGVLFIVSGCFGFASAVVRPWRVAQIVFTLGYVLLLIATICLAVTRDIVGSIVNSNYGLLFLALLFTLVLGCCLFCAVAQTVIVFREHSWAKQRARAATDPQFIRMPETGVQNMNNA